MFVELVSLGHGFKRRPDYQYNNCSYCVPGIVLVQDRVFHHRPQKVTLREGPWLLTRKSQADKILLLVRVRTAVERLFWGVRFASVCFS